MYNKIMTEPTIKEHIARIDKELADFLSLMDSRKPVDHPDHVMDGHDHDVFRLWGYGARIQKEFEELKEKLHWRLQE